MPPTTKFDKRWSSFTASGQYAGVVVYHGDSSHLLVHEAGGDHP